MKPSSFLGFYDKLEGLVRRLPESLQQPILREITPIKTLFLLQRSPRIVLLGAAGSAKRDLVNAILGSETIKAGEENLGANGWQNYGLPSPGILRLLDARRPVSTHL